MQVGPDGQRSVEGGELVVEPLLQVRRLYAFPIRFAVRRALTRLVYRCHCRCHHLGDDLSWRQGRTPERAAAVEKVAVRLV